MLINNEVFYGLNEIDNEEEVTAVDINISVDNNINPFIKAIEDNKVLLTTRLYIIIIYFLNLIINFILNFTLNFILNLIFCIG